MKADILKHTGLTEKQFYAKYKTADDFFNSKEGKSFKKAQNGYQGMGNVPKQFGTGIPPNTQIPQLLQDPYQNVNVAKPKLPTDPLQDEMLSAMSLQKKPSKAEQAYTATGMNQQILGVPPSSTPNTTTNKFGAKEAASMISPVGGAIGAFIDERKQRKEAEMWKNVTDVQLKASKTRPEQYDRKYVRPEDMVITGEELFPVNGVGTNPIAQNGSMIGGNPTEVQNMYNPYDLYEDLGYEPLNDSIDKQYQSGGDIAQAFSNPVNSFVSSQYNNNAGYQAGNTLGQAAKFIPGIGPIASAVASPLLEFIGGQLDQTFGDAGKIKKAQAATDRNISQIGLGQQAASVQAGFASHLKHGGNVQPQVLKYFGNNAVKDLFTEDPMMNTLQDGGELQTHWGGYAEPISQNPYLPDGGQTVMFKGNSHRETDGRGNTGIGVTYGNNPVEVERGEPAMKLQDGSGDPNMVVFGNLPINKNNASLLGDPKATNKRFKNYVADLSKQEAKHTKTLDKNTVALNELEVYDPFDKLTFASHQANMMGSNMNLKAIADKKQKAAFLQNAINETRDELSDHLGYTVSAEQLAKNGEITKDLDPVTRIAKNGMSIAQNGKKLTTAQAKAAGYTQNTKTGKWEKPGKSKAATASEIKRANALGYVPKGQHADPSGYWGGVTPEQFEQTKANNPWYDWTDFNPADPNDTLNFQQAFNNKAIEIGQPARLFQDDRFGKQTASAMLNMQAQSTPGMDELNTVDVEDPTPIEAKKSQWMNVLAGAIPYLRPSNAGRLDPNQLMGEMYAMSSNQVEPVQAQSYQPQLDVPYDISLQDQLNQVTSQTRAAQRMAGYNPATQAAIAGQAYEPANRILGEQFRLNQAKKDQVYSGNRAKMGEADRFNIEQYANQADKLYRAVSNTKQITQAALNSISDKYQRNALENKTLQTYENLYNYRFGPKMRAYNVNAPFQPNIPQVYNGDDSDNVVANATPVMDKKGNVLRYIQNDLAPEETKKAKTATTRNGSIVKALKRM